MTSSPYIPSMHPKSEIRFDRAAIKRVLDTGWAGQIKINGHRAQIHIPADPSADLGFYTRQGRIHTKAMPEPMIGELRRLFQPDEAWNVIDAEWYKATAEIFVFDILKRAGRVLRDLNYLQRWESLPRVYASDCIRTLTLLRTVDKCMEVFDMPSPQIEGLVFKSLASPGFSDTAIVRCRRTRA